MLRQSGAVHEQACTAFMFAIRGAYIASIMHTFVSVSIHMSRILLLHSMQWQSCFGPQIKHTISFVILIAPSASFL